MSPCSAVAEIHPLRAAFERSVHGPMRPADVRPGDPIFARVRPAASRDEREQTTQVWRISPLGVELLKPPAVTGLGPGETFDLKLRIGTQASEFCGLEVASSSSEDGFEVIGARWRQPEVVPEQRGCPRWSCGAEYVPTGIARNPARYGDFVHFRIADISRTGMQLVTSLRNTFLIPGASLEGTCTFPPLGAAELTFRVVHTRIANFGGKAMLSLGVSYADPDARTLELIGQYLLEFGPAVSVQELVQSGFKVRSSSRAFDFGSVETDEEYEEVLELRRLAYVRARKAPDHARARDMGDALDDRSRSQILVAKYRGRVVGTVRLAFPRSEADALKHEEFVELPASLPPPQELVEVSKACTHPDFRGSDLFYALLKHAALRTIQSGRRYVLISCTDALLPLYSRVGLHELGVSYLHPSMRLRHHVMLGDVRQMVSGKGINPILWNAMGGEELWSFANLCGVLPESLCSNLRASAWRLFKPLAPLARRYAGALRARGQR